MCALLARVARAGWGCPLWMTAGHTRAVIRTQWVSTRPMTRSTRRIQTGTQEFHPQTSRGRERGVSHHRVGDVLHGFTVQRVECLPDVGATAFQFLHDRTGARLLHFDASDMNNVFAFVTISLRTVPVDSTGVAHILEHTTLCGSHEFPVRDPFFNMIKRSLNTFMNAMTGPDHTWYPFSTQNEQDFYNLMAVYFDSVFRPLLREQDFRQEGIRLEFAQANDPTTPLHFKGIVYNEMKGAMGDPSSVFIDQLMRALYPTTTYGVNSGGDPEDIRTLTFEKVKEFHRKHYHPSNAQFVTYGDLPVSNHVQFLDSVLEPFDRQREDTMIALEPLPTDSHKIHVTGPVDEMTPRERQVKVAIAWLIHDAKDAFESVAMRVLSEMLLAGPPSPMFKALLLSGMGMDYAPGTGFDPSNRRTNFAIGLSGVTEGDEQKVIDVIYEQLRKGAEEEFDMRRVEAFIHQVELGLKHKRTDFGLSLMTSALHSWNLEADPVGGLRILHILEKLKEEISRGHFFEHRINKYLLNPNNPPVILIMRPDDTYFDIKAEQEQLALANLSAQLTDSDTKRIVQEGVNLNAAQENPGDPSCLPTIHLRDVPQDPLERIELHTTHLQNTAVSWSEQPTNDVTSLRLCVSVKDLPNDLKKYVPIYTTLLSSVACGEHALDDWHIQKETYIGGISSTVESLGTLHDQQEYDEYVGFGVHFLRRNTRPALNLLRDMLAHPRFDRENREVMWTTLASLSASFALAVKEDGHKFARLLARAPLDPQSYAAEFYGGISQVQFVNWLANAGCEDAFPGSCEDVLTHLAEKFAEINCYLLDKSRRRILVVAERDARMETQQALEEFLNDLPDLGRERGELLSHESLLFSTPSSLPRTFMTMDSPVNFVAQSFPGVPYTHEDNSALRVLAKLVSLNYVHREVREKGGAYGGFCEAGGIQRNWSFLSYRDPNTKATLDAFQRAVDWAAEGKFSDKDIEEAKIQVFQGVDAPVAPNDKGVAEFLYGMTYDITQRHRHGLLDVDRTTLCRLARQYLGESSRSSIAILGNTDGFKPFAGLKRSTGEPEWDVRLLGSNSQSNTPSDP